MFKAKKKKFTGPGVEDRERKNKDLIASEAALYGKDLVTHVMPDRFRSAKLSSRQAKKAGIIVLFFGMIFLIAAVIIFYLYVLKPRLTNNPLTPAPAEKTNTTAETDSSNKTSNQAAVSPQQVKTEPEPVPEPQPEPIFIVATTTKKTATTTRQVATSTVETPLPPALIDYDKDGLSDKEERLIGSNIANVDSDNDGYSDLNELINLYNPAGDGKLVESRVFSLYTNSTYDYSLYYSLGWPIKKFGGDDSIMFEIDGNQFFQIIVQPNADKESISDWFIRQFGQEEYSPARALAKNGWEGIAKANGLIFYLTDINHEYIITLSYNLGSEEVEYYKNIFNFLINTFTVNE